MGAVQEQQRENKKIPSKSSLIEGEIIDLTESPKRIKTEKNDEPECCHICCNDMDSTNWMYLKCSHKVCTICYKTIQTTRSTMEGIVSTFVKCPFCMGISGIEIGNCPNGTMTTTISPSSCAGYETFSTICTKYIVFNPEYTLHRTAYLPNNGEGMEVLKLLKIAWDRRLCFAIGTSATTGRQNVLVWNLHHKTAQMGGVEKYGYPDPTYLQRIKSELKTHGIE